MKNKILKKIFTLVLGLVALVTPIKTNGQQISEEEINYIEKIISFEDLENPNNGMRSFALLMEGNQNIAIKMYESFTQKVIYAGSLKGMKISATNRQNMIDFEFSVGDLKLISRLYTSQDNKLAGVIERQIFSASNGKQILPITKHLNGQYLFHWAKYPTIEKIKTNKDNIMSLVAQIMKNNIKIPSKLKSFFEILSMQPNFTMEFASKFGVKNNLIFSGINHEVIINNRYCLTKDNETSYVYDFVEQSETLLQTSDDFDLNSTNKFIKRLMRRSEISEGFFKQLSIISAAKGVKSSAIIKDKLKIIFEVKVSNIPASLEYVFDTTTNSQDWGFIIGGYFVDSEMPFYRLYTKVEMLNRFEEPGNYQKIADFTIKVMNNGTLLPAYISALMGFNFNNKSYREFFLNNVRSVGYFVKENPNGTEISRKDATFFCEKTSQYTALLRTKGVK